MIIPLDSPGFDWDTPRAELWTITPAKARSILVSRRHPADRPISPGKVAGLAEVMRAGLWELNGETVVFYRDGTLRNGQHRLMACARSGVPLVTYVVFGTG